MANRAVSDARFLAVTATQKSVNIVDANDNVSVTSVAAQNNLHTITVAFWAKLDSVVAGGEVYFFQKGASYLALNIWDKNNLYVQAKWSGGTAKWNKNATTLNFLQWHHYILTYDDSSDSNAPSLYVDNVAFSLPTTSTAPSGTRSADSTAFYIGNDAANAEGLRGKVYDFRLFGRIITANERNDIYNNRAVTSGLVGGYKLNEGSGTTAIDSTGNANGTLSGAVYSTDIPYKFTPRSTATNRFAIPASTQKSLSFNGTSSYATIPTAPDIAGFSLGCWVWLPTRTNDSRMVAWQTNASTDGFTITCETPNKWYVNLFNVSVAKFINLPVPQPVGLWCHVTFTHIQGTQKIYINRVQTDTNTGTMTAPSGQLLTLGRKSHTAGGYIAMKMKDFTYQNTTTPWTQAQIDELVYRNKIPSGALQWSMNDVATDQNGANALTLVNTSYVTDVPGHMTVRSAV